MHNDIHKVSIVTVNYKQPDMTMEFLGSIYDQDYKNIEVIVIDNSNDQKLNEKISLRFPNARYICADKNLGYAAGCNLGIKNATADFILLMNNDMIVPRSFLQPLVQRLLSDATIGMISPKILFHENPSVIQYAGASELHPITLRGRLYGNKQQDSIEFNTSKETAFIHGSCMMVRKTVIEEIGLMDESYFLYYEELDWSARARRHGYRIWYEGSSEVYHKESLSTGKDSPLKVYYINRNRLKYAKKNLTSLNYFAFLTYYMLIAYPSRLLRYSYDSSKFRALIKSLYDFIRGSTSFQSKIVL